MLCCPSQSIRGGIGSRTLEVGQVALLVERSALETERVDNVVDLDGRVLQGLLGLLSGRVGADVWRSTLAAVGFLSRAGSHIGGGARYLRTNLDVALGDHGAVSLVDDTVDLGEVVRVRDDLITADNVLVEGGRVLADLSALYGAAAWRCSFLECGRAHRVDNHLEGWSGLSEEIGQRLFRQGGRKRRWVRHWEKT